MKRSVVYAELSVVYAESSKSFCKSFCKSFLKTSKRSVLSKSFANDFDDFDSFDAWGVHYGLQYLHESIYL